jgi:hypothetical protein
MGTEQARPPTAAKPTVAAADPLRLQPGSAWARAAKTKGARDSPRPRQIRMPLPPPLSPPPFTEPRQDTGPQIHHEQDVSDKHTQQPTHDLTL